MTNRSLSGVLCLVLAPAVALAGCTASAPPATRSSAPAQPRTAAYDCGEDGRITIEHLGGMVRVHGPADPAAQVEEGDSAAAAPPAPVELAAAPPGQQSRYGAEGYALVLEGAEALWMKAGKAPLTCRR